MEPLSSSDERKDIAKAKRKWILLRGFGWGLTVFVITTALDYYGDPALYTLNARGLSRILFRLTTWLAGGYLLSLWAWNDRKNSRN
jgi:hypothetical protein